jgi:single-strand DNA-binding protein
MTAEVGLWPTGYFTAPNLTARERLSKAAGPGEPLGRGCGGRGEHANEAGAAEARKRKQDNMSGSVNKVILIGNLGRDPEVRRLNSGDPVVNFSVATTESWRDKTSGERKDRTEWHNVVIFNENLGRIAEQYLKKGSKVYLEGQLQTREYTDKDGNQRKATEVVLQRFRGELTLLDSRGRGGEAMEEAPSESGSFGRSSPMERRPANAGASRAPVPATHAIDDDIPF